MKLLDVFIQYMLSSWGERGDGGRGIDLLDLLKYVGNGETLPIIIFLFLQALLTAMTCNTIEVHGGTVLQAVR